MPTLRAVPPPRRHAELESPDGIREDLHFARDAGGLAHTGADQLQATTANVVAAGLTRREVAHNRAREILIAHVARYCRLAIEASADDPCAKAAAQSTRDVLLQAKDHREKVAAIRRRSLRTNSCTISLDALRKREDVILREIAAAVWEDLEARKEGLGPQTPEQVVLMMIPIVKDIHYYLFELLLRLYPTDAIQFDDTMANLTEKVIHGIAEVQWFARTYLAVLERPKAKWSQIDLVFASHANGILLTPFFSDAGRDAVAEVFLQYQRREEFTDALMARADFEELAGRIVGWLSSCHSNCAFHRTRSFALLCEPHLLVYYFELFLESADEVFSGEIARDMHEALGTLQIPEFVRHYARKDLEQS